MRRTGNDFPQASTCGEVVLNSDFYSYDTKYIDDKGAQVVVPAALDPDVNDKIRAIAVEAYQALMLWDGARRRVSDAG